jgi:ribosome-binding factor A
MKNKGDGRRVARVEQEIQKTVAQFLISGFRHPLPGLVTVARVMMPGDLRTAKVYISVLGDEKQRKEALETLNDRAFEVQHYIGKELRMRYCPKIQFYQDDTTEHVLRIDRILHDLEESKKKETPPSDEES